MGELIIEILKIMAAGAVGGGIGSFLMAMYLGCPDDFEDDD